MPPRNIAVFLIALATLSCQTTQDETAHTLRSETRPWTVDDTLALVNMGDVALSPDGKWVMYSERRLNWKKNDYDRTCFVVSTRGGKAGRRADLDKAKNVCFTPDSTQISFVAKVDGEGQVFTVGLQGGKRTQITDHDGGVDKYAWSPDGARLYFAAEEPREPEAQEEWDAGGDAVFVGEDGNGLDVQRWSNLWVHDLATDTERRLTDLKFTINDMDVAPDGERVVFTGCSDNRSNYDWRSELYVVDRRNMNVVKLTENDAPEQSPKWSPDGSSIAYHSPNAKSYDLRHGYLWLVNPLTGNTRRLDGQHLGELKGFWWSRDGKTLLFGESRGVSANLYELNLASSEVHARTQSIGTLTVRDFSADRSVYIYTHEDHKTPADLWAAGSVDKPVRLTNANPWVGEQVAVSPSEVVRWKSDGHEIEGVLTLPANWNGATRLPLVMDIHGGPPGYWGSKFEPEQQALVAMGYAVFSPNPRGSSSYGDEHLRALMGDVGGGEYRDLMTGVDHLIARGVADPDRLALRGWSWGGVLGAWTITQTHRFKAASLGAMVGDWVAETGGGLMFDLELHYIGSTPWENREEWSKRSALTYVKNVKTPTLLLHGDDDDVSTVNQSQMFYTALRDRDVPVRLIKFPEQGHDINKPRLRRIALVEELSWFERHVRGVAAHTRTLRQTR